MPPQLNNNALSLQPLHRQHVAYTSHYGCGGFSDFALIPLSPSAAVGSNCEDTAPAKVRVALVFLVPIFQFARPLTLLLYALGPSVV